MRWASCILLLLLPFFSTPLYPLRTIPTLFDFSLAKIVCQVTAEPDTLSEIYDQIPWYLQAKFAERLSQPIRVKLILLWYAKIDSLKRDHDEYLAYKAHYQNIANELLRLWFRKPYKVRQETLDKDLDSIEKARVPAVDASRLLLTPNQFARLSSFVFLKRLNLSQTITGQDVSHILRVSLIERPTVQLPNLGILILNNCDLRNGFIIDWLRYMPNLVVLDASGNSFGEVVYRQLKELKKLRVLIAKNCSLNRERVEALSEIRQLRRLDLENNGLDHTRLQSLGALVNLHHLSLADNSGITQDLDFLESLPLFSLDISGCTIIPTALTPLRGKESLLYLRVSNTVLADQVIADVLTLPNLEGLTMACVGLSSVRAKKLLAKSGLVSLRIPSNDLKVSAFENFRNYSLRELNLSHNPLGNEIIKILKPFEGIRKLNLEDCDLTEDILHDLLKMKHLKQIWLDQNSISEGAICDVNSFLQSP